MTLQHAIRATGRGLVTGLAYTAGAGALSAFVAWAAVAQQTCTDPKAGATLTRILPNPPLACHQQARVHALGG